METIPMTMRGLSMAPWFVPGDVLLIRQDVSPSKIQLGDVVVFHHIQLNQQLVHRVIHIDFHQPSYPLQTKGDRNFEKDHLDSLNWKFQGVVTQRFRKGKWKKLRWKKLLLWLSVNQFYPGQKLPHWLGKWHPNLSDWLV